MKSKKDFGIMIMTVGIYAMYALLIWLTNNVEWIDDVMNDIPMPLAIFVVSWALAYGARFALIISNRVVGFVRKTRVWLGKEEETERIEVAE